MNLRELAAGLAIVLPACCRAADSADVASASTQLDGITVTAARPTADADSATIGTVYSERLENRPISRPGELLEVVPGLIVTQHSGEGKANQYFLRGYNLDHGTDFALFVDGLPVNMPTHAHGQGYADNGFFIPELVDSIEYRKGPYYARYGDFSAAGAAEIRYKEVLEHDVVEATGGAYGYGRLLGLDSRVLAAGTLVYGLEYVHYDGPYELKQSFNKGNVVLRYTRHYADGSFHLAATGYSTRNLSPDQIPQRAVDQGLIGYYGSIDPTDGGRSHRVNFSGGLEQALGAGKLTFDAYAFRYRLDLFSDFTYFLDDPVRGDQFEQSDRRNVYGGNLRYERPDELFGLPLATELGLQTRYDDIGDLALYRTQAQQRYDTTTTSTVREWSGAAYAQTGLRFNDWLRLTAGLRFDSVDFDVRNNFAANSGRASGQLASPKVALVFGPWRNSEFFIDAGQGFHSNDARGAVQHVDPRNPDPATNAVDPVTPLVPARGIDLGLRSTLVPRLQLAASVFRLRSASELVYVGDAGTTEPFGAAERYGGELALDWRPQPRLLIDGDVAYTRARFREQQRDETGAAIGRHVPQAVQGVAALGMAYTSLQGWDAALRLRYFGPRPLNESGSIRSQSTTVVNLGFGWRLSPRLRVSGQIDNLLDSKDHDIDYAYTSRLSGEPAGGVADVHFHPIEPINGRVSLSYAY